MAIFVVQQRHRHLGQTQRAQRIHRVQLVEDYGSRPQQPAQVQRFAAEQSDGDIARLHDADHRIDRSFCHRKAAVRHAEQGGADTVLLQTDIDPFDIGARRHHLAHRAVGEPHHAGNDRTFMLLDHAGLACLGDDQVQFFRRYVILGLALQAHQLEQQGTRRIEQPAERRGAPGEPVHRWGHEYGDRLGRTQGDLLGHQFTDDQREIGGDADDQRKADRAGRFLRKTKPAQPRRDGRTQAGARISTCQNTDQRDADLNRGQEFARVGGKNDRRARAALAGARHRLQPRLPGRDDRQF